MKEQPAASHKITQPKFLSQKWEKVLKGVHLTFVSLTIGGVFSILVLFFLKSSDWVDDFMIDWSMFQIFGRIVYYSFLGNFATGLAYSLFTRWGFFKAHWVTVKWVGFLVLFMVLAFGLEPALSGLVALSDSGLYLAEGRKEYLSLWNRGILSVVVLAAIFIILLFVSTIKPWKLRKKDLIPNLKLARILLLSITFLSVVFGIYSSAKLSEIRNISIVEVNLARYQDGIYEGVFYKGGGPYKVQVAIVNKKITDIQLITTRQSKYVRYAKGVIPRIIAAQSPAVDGITGATTTSKCIMKAVEDALD